MDITEKKTAKGWLQKLKEESWEAELLVSAIAIFGTFKLLGVIDWITNTFIDLLYPEQYLIGYVIVFFGLFAISILASMFVIHFFLRAYWIGLVGLNSVFPDYGIEDSIYSKIYTEKIINLLPKLKSSIEEVDELCSVIFSAAFTFLLMYTYMGFFSSIYILLYNTLADYIPSYILLIPLILLFFLFIFQIVFSIYANLKSNKEKKKVQIFLFRIMKFLSIIMYGPLYKSILQVSMIFSSNFKKKKRLSYLMIVFLFSGSFVAIYQIEQTNIPYLISYKKYFSSTKLQANFYEVNNTKNTYLLTPEIESDILKNTIVKVFIPLFTHEKKIRKNICEFEKENITKQEEDLLLLECYNQYLSIFVNNTKIASDFLRYTHPRTKQFGVITYIKLNNLDFGKNNITIKKGSGVTWKIPFYYAINKKTI